MEADISIWQKTGHFYFALTAALFPSESFSKEQDQEYLLLVWVEGTRKPGRNPATI